MSRIVSALAIATAFAARYPGLASSEILPSLNASAETLPNVQAMAVRGFSPPSGKLVWVKAQEHFLVAGETIAKGDFVEIPEVDANALVKREFAEIVDAETVADAQAADAKKAKG